MFDAIRNEIAEEYAQPHESPWIVGFSGGKDSTLVAHLVIEHLLSIPRSDRTRAVHIVANDTLVESPLVIGHIRESLGRLYGRESLGRARTEGLLDTLRTFAAAAAAFGDLDRAQDWLDTALPALGGDRPIDICDTFEGRRLVREIIRKVEYGELP